MLAQRNFVNVYYATGAAIKINLRLFTSAVK